MKTAGLFIALLSALLGMQVNAAPNALSDTAHAAALIRTAAITVLGAGIVDTSVFCDETSTDNGTNFLSPSAMITAAADGARSNFQCSDNSGPVNHAPYTVLSQSSSGYFLFEPSVYTNLNSAGIIYDWAIIGALTPNTPPGVYSTNIANSTNPSAAGGGVEFTMTPGYKGLVTSDTSSITADFSGLLWALKVNHPTWTWPDIKGAVRQTASNWATGYKASTYGYGFIDYDAANAVASTSAIFLQPPFMQATSPGMNQITVTIYPYRQTRRNHEVVYLVPFTYVWPVKNEYALSDITASGGTLIYTSNNTDVTPTATVGFAVTPGRYNLVAFTTDNLGAYSRHEVWSDTAIMGNCL
jgi:hypothetical protein